uniref:Uncharacterized protein n=1 Tax=uncultured Desulfobacterium sp. TaxID=201089 RepID=E1YHV7_9BACT|nr:unknown protein [uncultured Desulfobacterium sp.]
MKKYFAMNNNITFLFSLQKEINVYEDYIEEELRLNFEI